jgi:Protein of unknown function (DUF4199)
MKTYLTYGFAIALGNALLTLIFYLLGFHSDPDKIQMAGFLAMPVVLAVGVTATILGMRAQRKATPSTEEFSYGRAFATGFMIALFAALFGAIFQYVYLAFINPDFAEIVQQAQAARLEAKGLSSEQIDRMQHFARMFMKPAVQAILGIIGGVIWGTVISLIIAAFVKRPASTPAP